jgi:alpha-tubulin suppressor-like RCC1 family protein
MKRTKLLFTSLVAASALAGCGGGSNGTGGTPPPTLSGTINGQSRVVTNQLYTYSATASDGTPANYSWAWGDGKTDVANGSSGVRTKVWRAAGNVTATLTLTDSTGGTASASQAVAIVDHPVSAGNEHSCAILSDNTVACWGNNISGQLGDGKVVNSNLPKVIPNFSNVVSLAAFGYSTCAAKSDGTVWCWGFQGYAGANFSNLLSTSTPQQISGLNDVVALTGGDNSTGGGTHACALQRSGTVQCWGNNDKGELGRGGALALSSNTPSIFVPQTVVGLSDAVSISAAGHSTCAVKADGTVVCWGYGGQNLVRLGVNVPSSTVFALSSPISVVGVSNVVSLSMAHNGNTCAVITDGSLTCWGTNGVNHSGLPISQMSTTMMGALPTPIIGIANIAAITLGLTHTCALKTDATVVCWGTYGTRANFNSAEPQTTPLSVKTPSGAPLTEVQSVSSGMDHTCASKFDGSVHCWGWNSSGQLGDGLNVDHVAAMPVVMPGKGQLAAGTNHSCAFNALGQVSCIGQGSLGQLGNGSSANSTTPVDVNIAGGVKAISSAAYHTCAIKSADSNITCWGLGADGQLGNGANVDSNVPVSVAILGGAKAISAGAYHSCALKTNGDIACWGQNTFGQLGNGANTNLNTPVTVSIAGGFTAVSAGTFHTCALTSSGAMMCWGRSAEGQLGNLSNANFNTPQSVNIPGGVASISSTTFHTTCVRTIVGDAAVCWGRGSDGQLGNGNDNDSNAPTAVSNLSGGIASISAGYHHTCALKTDGNVACWGQGSDGQIGNGANSSSNVPVTISIPGGVTSISAGYYHTCAFKSNGEVVCWGRGYGNVPVLVPGLGASVTFWK